VAMYAYSIGAHELEPLLQLTHQLQRQRDAHPPGCDACTSLFNTGAWISKIDASDRRCQE
jgi:hypothetical protein